MNQTIKQLIVAAVCVLAVTVPLTVYAYLQKDLEQPNNFIIDEGKEAVTEEFTNPEYMSMQDSFTKKVAVKNTGTSDQFVRVYLDFSDSRVRDNSTIVYTKNNTATTKKWTEFLDDLPENWKYISESDAALDGYFYYTRILESGDTTNPLIDGIETNFKLADSKDDANTDRIMDFNIIVYSESVQTVEIDSSGTIYTDYKAAWKSFLKS